jgi:hypothetical protein
MRVIPQDFAASAAMVDLLSLEASTDEFGPDEPRPGYAGVECLPSLRHALILGSFQA